MHKKYLLLTTMLAAIPVFTNTAGASEPVPDTIASKNTDKRKLILLDNNERDFVLAEMRAFLISVQQISQGLAENNMALVVKQARVSGKAAQAGTPATLAKKLPPAFKILGSDTHAKFDQLAMDADDFGDKDHTLKQLSTLLKNCVSCHATFRIGQ